MNLNRATKTRLIVDVTADIDLTGATVEVKVDETWHPAEWTTAPTTAAGKWTRTARTTGYFAGPDAVAAGATVLAATPYRHLTKTRVTVDGDVLTAPSDPVDIR